VPITVLPDEEAEFWLQASQASLDALWDNAEDDVSLLLATGRPYQAEDLWPPLDEANLYHHVEVYDEINDRARRWMVERTHSWMNRFRRLLIRWEKKPDNYLAMMQLASAFITFRSAEVLGEAPNLPLLHFCDRTS
jgi:putative transposase